MPTGAKTADEVLAEQTPTICNLQAHLAIRGLAVVVLAWNGFSLAMLETTELDRVMSYLSVGIYTVGLVASFASFSAPKFAQSFYILVAAQLVAVLGVDIYQISQVLSARSPGAAEAQGGAGGAPEGGAGSDGDSKTVGAPNLTVAVFSLLVNAILHVGCLFCARCVMTI